MLRVHTHFTQEFPAVPGMYLSLQGFAKQSAKDSEGWGNLSVNGPYAGAAQALHAPGDGGEVPHHHEAQHKAHSNLNITMHQLHKHSVH